MRYSGRRTFLDVMGSVQYLKKGCCVHKGNKERELSMNDSMHRERERETISLLLFFHWMHFHFMRAGGERGQNHESSHCVVPGSFYPLRHVSPQCSSLSLGRCIQGMCKPEKTRNRTLVSGPGASGVNSFACTPLPWALSRVLIPFPNIRNPSPICFSLRRIGNRR